MNHRICRALALLLSLGMTGTFAELLLFGHHEDVAQLTPLVLLVVAASALLWMWVRPRPAAVRAFKTAMWLLIAGGLAGVGLHFRANMEFQLELDPGIDRGALIAKVLHAKAPPALAPGALAQLGLLGLVLAHGHTRHIDPSLVSD